MSVGAGTSGGARDVAARRAGPVPDRRQVQRGEPGILVVERAPVDSALVERVRARLAAEGRIPTAEDVARAVRRDGLVLGAAGLPAAVAAVQDEVLGAGPLQPLLDDPAVTDVLVNAPDEVWVDRHGVLVRTTVDLGTSARVRELAVRLAAAGGQRLDDASPLADAHLPDGTRLHAVLPPLGGDCTVLSLRTLRRQAFTLEALVRTGTVAPGLEPVLRGLVAARASVLVSGGTGAGKTTLLATLLGLVPPGERIVCIEEAAELQPRHPHVVHLLARRANVDGAGEIGLAVLVREALRMRPDRIVLGECRGAEVRDVLTALNTGHDGFATVHANAAGDVPVRLEALGSLAGMTRESVDAQACAALDAVVHLRREGARRWVQEVAVVGRTPAGGTEVVSAVVVSRDGRAAQGPGWDRLAERLADV